MPEIIPGDLEQQLKELVASVIFRSPDDLKLETNFFKDLGVDSIKAIEIVVAIEKKFKVSIRDEQVTQINTFGEALEIVKKGLQKK